MSNGVSSKYENYLQTGLCSLQHGYAGLSLTFRLALKLSNFGADVTVDDGVLHSLMVLGQKKA